ncbi:YjfB family protein [Halobacillus sp. ACCC02827]|uniref:YjfB family protein n=1 Tax=Bacillaceae TaxID=186817 RepID=UPI0002A4FA0E|nr:MULTISPECIES: YjfB family protein [Bacillaceae]ELK49071.1 hypothetical protein D479_00535 [Halobacillus sp. BAB-2008]QHT48137.1 putative motility protein [Bacillus sp. SB49]WJE15371.1 YjfB family protein [Halobacillus sp. ACCC02827]
MDIAALSMALSTTQLKQQTNLALMDKVMGDADTKGARMVEMMENSIPHPDLGNSLDIKA